MRQIDTFQEIKSLVQNTIKQNKTFVTPTTNWKISGIYMIYIDANYDDEVLPIYIGKSKNIQGRYKKHLESLLGLNRIHPDVYRKLFFEKKRSYYEGAFRTCKIHKYMVERYLSLKDFHMIVLETCEPEKLDERELHYIDRFYAAYFGFNQLNSRTYIPTSGLISEPTAENVGRLMELLEQEMVNLPKFLEYGFTHFNLNHAFPTLLPEKYAEVLPAPNDLLKFNRQLELFNQTHQDIWQNLDYIKLMEERSACKREIEALTAQMDLIQQPLINKNDSRDVYSAKEADSITRRDWKDHYNSLIQRNKRNIISFSIKKKWAELFNKDLKQYRLLQVEKESWKEKEQVIHKKMSALLHTYKKKRYHEIIPNIEYSPFALQDRLVVGEYKNVETKANHLYIDLVFSSPGRRFEKEQVPYLISVGMRCYNERLEEEEYRWYVKNECTELTKKGLVYGEEDYLKMFVFSKEKFKPYAYTRDNEPYLSSISVGSEIKSGINDYTIQSHVLTPLSKILENVEEYIDDDTTIAIFTSEGPQTYERALLSESVVDSNLFQILLAKRPKSNRIVIKAKKKPQSVASRKVAAKNLTDEERVEIQRLKDQEKKERYINRVKEVTDGYVKVVAYTGSKKDAAYHCILCGYEWTSRSDRIFSRNYCPNCRKSQKK